MDRNRYRIPALTAERRYGSIDRLDEDALPVKLRRVSRELHSQVKRGKKFKVPLHNSLHRAGSSQARLLQRNPWLHIRHVHHRL